MNELMFLKPEIFVLSMTCIVLLTDLYLPKTLKIVTYWLAQFTLLGGAYLCWTMIPLEPKLILEGHVISDPLAHTLKMFMLIVVSVVLLYSRRYIQSKSMPSGEYFMLALFSTLGMMCMVSAKTTLMIYLGLELFSLPVYTLVALNRESSRSVEAGMKYFIMGALASGMLLYGLSILYGLTGTLDIDATANALVGFQGDLRLMVFALIFIVAGIAFKFGAVPFHMWIPDVYEGAASSVTLFIASAPKIAAFGMTYRLLVEAVPQLSEAWGHFFIVLAVLSLAVGNVIALAQTNLKRMLAYSTISHVGFILLGFLAGTTAGFDAALFYVVVYAITVAFTFGCLCVLSRKGIEAENIEDFKGLGQSSPWLAFLMMLSLFSLAGVPPTVGFYAKFMVLNAVVSTELTWLAIVAVFFTIIGAFYYIRVIRMMYFESSEKPVTDIQAIDTRIALSINGLAVLALGIFPGPLFVLCQRAFGG